MKKRLNFIALIITTMPFAFSKMEGPFKGGTKENFYYFLYEQTTGYTIGYIPRPEIPNNDIIRFLKGNPDLLDKNSTPKPQFYFTKEKPNLNLKETTELTELSKISKYFNHFLKEGIKFEDIESPLVTVIPLRKKFSTLSNTKIKNKDNYAKICNFHETQSVNVHVAFEHYNDNKSHKFLMYNQILAVYGVIKNPYKKNCVLWGLAQDITTSKKFYWITDFEDDSLIHLLEKAVPNFY